jgi:taurine dioxygenase
MNIQPLPGNFGVQVNDMELRSPLDAAALADLIALLYRHAVVCVREQRLSPQQLENFARQLGKPVQHNEENLRLQGLPAVMSLSNADQRDDRQLNGGGHWHTDLVHTEEPASFTMLHAVAVPRSGGRTFFANQVAAYESLPDAEKSRLEQFSVIHCYEGRTDGSMPETQYPLVRKHPVTGKKALYGAADTGIGIAGLPRDEALRIYAEVGAYATQECFLYRHQYRVDDVVIWDNAQLLHAAEALQRATSASERRIMHRVSVRGWPGSAPAVGQSC